MTDPQHYTVTAYIAAPGTPLVKEKEPGMTSLPGHMFYAVSDGVGNPQSFGFAPAKQGSIDGPGTISSDDVENYQDPLYSRTMEISKEQYDKLHAFGKDPEKFGFDKYYKDLRHNCVDFTWAALNHAGMKRTELLGGRDVEVDGKWAYRPAENISSVRSIPAPFPDSPLNQEHTSPMPKRSVLQHLLTEDDQPLRLDAPSHRDHAMFLQAREGVHKLDATHNRVPDLRSDNLAASLTVAARAKGMDRIDHVVISDDASRLFAIQGKLDGIAGLEQQYAHVQTVQGLNTPITQSSAAWERAMQHQQAQELVKAQQKAPHQDAMQMAQPGPVMRM